MGAFAEKYVNRSTLFDFFLITIGSFLVSFSFVVMVVPNGLLSMGFTGICVIVNHFIPAVPISVLFYLMNVPFVIWALKELNKRFLLYTFYAVTLQTVLMEVLKVLPVYIGDLMLVSIFSAVIGGVGCGLIIRRGGSGGGVDILGIIMKKRRGLSVGTVSMIFNIFVVGVSAFVFGLDIAMYTIIFIAAFSVATDKSIAGMGKNYTVMIITKDPEKMKNAIFDRLHRGVTLLKGKSAFSGDQKDVIYCAINRYELAILKDMVYSLDPDVFMTIHEITEIYGHFRDKRGTALSAAEVETHVVEEAQRVVTAKVDPGQPVVKVINRHGAIVDEVTLPGEDKAANLHDDLDE
ncbi:MAG: YitT family protein [Firmicutes bacterium]|nr:YitT family protein [Bacillota bacterium]MBQ4092542.1 YitT family protein [Bacillota bacterium]